MVRDAGRARPCMRDPGAGRRGRPGPVAPRGRTGGGRIVRIPSVRPAGQGAAPPDRPLDRAGVHAGEVRRVVLRGAVPRGDRTDRRRDRGRRGLVGVARGRPGRAPCRPGRPGVADPEDGGGAGRVRLGARRPGPAHRTGLPGRRSSRRRSAMIEPPGAGTAASPPKPAWLARPAVPGDRPFPVRVLAPNPGPFTLQGTNTWIVGRAPSVVIDPGPPDQGHLEAVRWEAGDVAAILVTHQHPDHAPGGRTLSEM